VVNRKSVIAALAHQAEIAEDIAEIALDATLGWFWLAVIQEGSWYGAYARLGGAEPCPADETEAAARALGGG
jgi:hypothetical protein